MRILLTRPIEQSQQLATLLNEKDIEVEICPLMTIYDINCDEINDRDYRAIIFTSSNSLRFYDLSAFDKDVLIFTVGNKTASKVLALGFENVISADGDLEKLSETIKNNVSPTEGPLLYVRGQHIAGRLGDDLIAAGYEVFEKIVYETRALPALDEKVIKLLLQGDIDFIPFYSQRSALIFNELIMQADLKNALANVSALCISANVAKEIGSLPWKKIMISDRPTQKDIFKLIAIDI